ncbi:hypothetical protein H3Z83_01695 [Tenacibaculum sp. S7007]|uniref:Lipoprotein n=1 Tax=Tenacibaculum pelagium TaxID=2759527 RepID=A0A839ALJ5_9FLAO|nr:hypothetical protein [Tenacibaculum pelagium]MBA6155240.1 hypothetical protein [Tenacibaculum pelagium]
MKNNKHILILLFITLFLSSCMPTRHYINNVVKTGEIDKSSTKQILIAGNDKVELNNFKKTFEKNFKTDKAFLESYLNEFRTYIKLNNQYSKVEIDANKNWDLLAEGYNAGNQNSINLLFLNTNQNYLFYIKGFKIDNRIVTSYSPGFGPGSFGQHNSTEFCVVTTKFAVYDIKKQKQLLEFDAIGESSVFMFDFTKTLLKAKARSIENAVKYIKTGKTS